MKRYCIDAPTLINAVEELAGQRFEISGEEVSAARTDTDYHEMQQEAL